MTSDRPFVGRRDELSLLDRLWAQLGERGSSLLVEGEPGVGKTALVNEFERRVRARNARVLRTLGTPSEAAAPYSGLHLLLQPLLAGLPGLPPPQRDALRTAFGIQDGSPPQPFLTGLAALTLLTDEAQRQPLMIVGEDLQWLDPASRTALLVVSRRIASDPILVILTTRSGTDRLDADGIARLPLSPLSFIEANAILDQRAEAPGGAVRRSLLELAAGNPLALVELTASDLLSGGPDVVPLTRRLERAFAGRYAELPRQTRLVILAAAHIGGEPIHAAAAAARQVLGRDLEPDWLSPAVAAGLIEHSRSRIRFRHPLVRSAVTSTSDAAERATMLGALVDTLDDPDQTVWWRAELAIGPDRGLADELDRHARSSLIAGDSTRAALALRRAVDLTVDADPRDDRLVRAADAAGQAGAYRLAEELLHRAAADVRGPGLRARASWIRERLPIAGSSLARGDFRPALDAIEAMRRAGETDAALTALLELASIAWNLSTEAHPGADLAAAVGRFDLSPDDPRMLLLTAVTRPAGRADDVIERIRCLRDIDPDDAETGWYLGYALDLCGDVDGAVEHLRRSVGGLRRRGQVALLPHALMGLAWICHLLGEFAEGRACIDECIVIATDLNDPGLAAAARSGMAWYDAIAGVSPDREAIAAACRLAPHVLDARDHQATLTLAEGMAALADGRPRDALPALLRITDPGDSAYQPMFRIVSLPDLVDAAVSTGNQALARAQFDAVTEATRGCRAQVIVGALGLARIMLTEDSTLVEAGADLQAHPLPVPLFHARAQLHLGSRLRRLRRIKEARRHLHAALDAFESFPAPAWAQRCREELRASGERLAEERLSGRHVLTPQELRIGELAASGLSNREIAEQLFLSPRTIGAHLYSAFRKLGITAREQLPEVLGSRATSPVPPSSTIGSRRSRP